MQDARLILVSISALFFISMSLAHAAEQPVPRTISDITEFLKQYQPDPKLVEQNRAKARAEPPADLSGPALAQFFSDRAFAAAEIGDARGAIADQRKAVEIARTPANLRFLSNFLYAGGNNVESLRLNESLMSSNSSPVSKVGFANSIVQFHWQTGNRDEARAALRQSDAAYRGAGRSDQTDRFVFRARGWVLTMDGKWDEAEVALRRSVDAAKAYSENPGGLGVSAVALQASADNVRNNTDVDLAAFLTARNRLDEAEVVLRAALTRILARQGPYHVRSGIAIHAFAELLTAQGRYPEATLMARAAVAAYEAGGAVAEAHGLASARRALATSLVLESRWAEALTAFEQLRSGLTADPGSLALYGRGDAYWGLALVKSDRAQDAVALLAPRVEQDRKVLGEGHPSLALVRGVLGMALARSGERQRAFVEFQAATTALLAAGIDRTAAEALLMRHVLDGYIGLLFEIRGTPLETELKVDAAREAFQLADLSRGQRVQGTLALVAARAAAGDPAIAELVRKEQDLGGLMQALYSYLLNQMAQRPEEQSPKLIGDLQKRVEEMRAERNQIREQLQKRFPRYADLVNPRPPTLEQTRGALREGEVLLSVLTTADRSYVWAVPRQGPVGFHAAELGSLALERIVAGLRRSLDPTDTALSRLPEFDVGQAARLYDTLLKPVEESWAGASTLLVVAGGALAQLPFGVLPTSSTSAAPDSALRFASYGSVPWLNKRIAIAQLPAVNTLITLRVLPVGSAQRTAFAGFGDPQFGIQAGPNAVDTATVAMRNLGIRRVTQAGLREGSAPTEFVAYGSLPALPDTREEILAIASALKADTSRDVFLGAAASMQNVKTANLATRRILAFATHGLVPGDFPGLDQPALALASPDGKAETGLLTLEEILQLKLDADWVVLSACNTAAGDGAGAEAISGLGRGFFYAGSRALLVTHWPVETRSARQLVTTLFERYAADPKLSRAEALRQASLVVMEDSAKDASGKALFSYAHPLFWAPYALVGDGGR